MEKRESFHKNQRLRLQVTSMTLEGMGVARHHGQVIFIPASAPGDVLEVQLVKIQKRLAYGKILQIVTASPYRAAADCSVYPRCGGCRFRHVDYRLECQCKNTAVQENLRRLGGLSLSLPPLIPSPKIESYRNKAIYPVSTDAQGRLVAGFYAPRSHRVQDCSRCALQPKVFDALRQTVLDFCTRKGVPAYDEFTGQGVLRQIYLRRGHYTGQVMVCLILNGNSLPDEGELVSVLRKTAPDIRSILLMENTARANVLLSENIRLLYGDGFIQDNMCGLSLTLSPLSFYQINTPAAETLYGIAGAYAGLTGKETVLDFYCGVGAIGLSMAYQAKVVIGVEAVPAAVTNAQANAKASGINNARFFCADAGEAAHRLLSEGLQPDVLLLDPPRAGCDSLMRASAAKLSPKRIVYISCNSATLARDAAFFAEHGYVPVQAQAVDLFPRTGHVETVVLLSRKSPIPRE